MISINLFASHQQRSRHREQTDGHGEMEEEDEKYGKSNMESYIIICKIDSQQEFAVCLRKLKQGFCNNLEGWVREGARWEFQERGDICILMADSC